MHLSKKNYHVFFALIIGIELASQVSAQNFLDSIDKQCWRRCDTHFTGAECWEKTFNYFINDLLQSIVDYSNVLHKTSSISGNTLNEILNQTYKEYRKEMEKFVNTITIHKSDFDQIFYTTIQKIALNPTTNVINSNLKEIKCPEKCNKESLTVWISLFGVLIGLTFASIIFIIAYVVFSKLQYRKFDKKMTNGNNSALAT